MRTFRRREKGILKAEFTEKPKSAAPQKRGIRGEK